MIFYIVVAAGHLDLVVLREAGWLFDMGTSREPWYYFYSLYGAWVQVASPWACGSPIMLRLQGDGLVGVLGDHAYAIRFVSDMVCLMMCFS